MLLLVGGELLRAEDVEAAAAVAEAGVTARSAACGTTLVLAGIILRGDDERSVEGFAVMSFFGAMRET